jgi:predicted CoA-substrate-specific enzyme activase
MIFAGVDSGSRAVKAVVFDAAAGRMLGMAMADQGLDQAGIAEFALAAALIDAGLERSAIAGIIATGYGRNSLGHPTVTEITCHAAGIHFLVPGARTVVDIGGQDSKVIHLDGDGAVRDFSMNDRCAAGTGRFLEVVAQRMQSDIRGIGNLVAQATSPAVISSMCVVFAETEIIGLLASGKPPADILAGVQKSIAVRIASMAGRQLRDPVVFTGGVARVPGMAAALESVLQHSVQVAPHCQFTGALGAALLAARRK